MPNTSFLCIDDQQDQSIEDLLRLLNETEPSLSFLRKAPVELGEQIRQISDAAKASDSFGLLLDLRLDMEAADDGTKVPYRGPTLAQELRTRMAEKDIRAFPIVLWSINEKFLKSFFGDDTSHDLFDAVYGKDEEVTRSPDLVCRQMVSLSQGYRRIEAANRKGTLDYLILGLRECELGGVNAAFIGYFQDTIAGSAEHEVSLRLLGDLVKPLGLLADEPTVAARLGVDQARSGSDWHKLLDILESSRYDGPFGDGWHRWWWFRIENWWNSLLDRKQNLRRLGASERVGLLNMRLGLTLIPATPIEKDYSDKYFTICVATGKPLDPSDGLRIAMPGIKTWNDVQFVSVHAALNRVAKDRWQIDPLDRDRLDQLKSS